MSSKPSVSNSEALFGFVAWLTTRFDQITFSQHNDSAVAIELVQRFCNVNGFKFPDKGWESKIETPELMD